MRVLVIKVYGKQSEKMIPSLRYLCLEKVIAQGDDYADLPEILVKDITIMKAFNGTYTYDWGSLGSWDVTVVMKIFYDGKVWRFKIRTCYHDSNEIFKTSLREVKNWLARLVSEG